jgi:cytochrome bd ubiquinol oxidase subunit I
VTDAATADRIQFAFTVLFHYVFPITTMGLAPIIVYFKTMHLRTGEEKYSKAAQFWARIFGINFAAGVVTGIPMEFQFGTNWAAFSNFAGGVVGQTLAMEGIFAFFLESGFLGLFLFGEGRISPFLHWLSALLLGLGAWLSGFFITATDAWMQHPVGYTVQNGRAHLTSLWALLGNPFAWWQYVHVINGAIVAGCIGIAAIGAFYLLARREADYEVARLFVATGVVGGAIFSITQVFPTGDFNARNVLQYQPPKQAAYEGLFNSQRNAPLSILGFPSVEQHRLLDPIEVPGLLSFLSYGNTNRQVPGIDAFKASQVPPVQITYYSYHLMVGLGTLFVAVCLLGVLLLLWGRRLYDQRWFLWILMLMLPLPWLANLFGWTVSEVGRQPWIVWGLMPTSKGYSPTVVAGETIFTTLVFAAIYLLLGVLFLFLAGKQIALGTAGTVYTPEAELGAQARAEGTI